jgi:hypothetical protein
MILGTEEGRKMMVEPPRYSWRSGVFEVDDGVLIASEFTLVKEGTGAVDKAVILIACTRGDALAVKAGEQ